jgi:hypothetical protein
MKNPFFFSVLLALLFAGCGSKPPSEDAAKFDSAFKKTEPHVREFAEQAVEAESKNDYSTAFRHYRALSLNPDLTPEQRNAANASMLEMSKKLRESAEQGNKEAEQMLQEYRATK